MRKPQTGELARFSPHQGGSVPQGKEKSKERGSWGLQKTLQNLLQQIDGDVTRSGRPGKNRKKERLIPKRGF